MYTSLDQPIVKTVPASRVPKPNEYTHYTLHRLHYFMKFTNNWKTLRI